MPPLSLRAAALAAFCVFSAAPQALQAQDVTLSPHDGGLVLSGTLLSFDGEFYRIDSAFGLLTLDAQSVVCAGPGCPDLTGFVPEVLLGGSQTLAQLLLPTLLDGFATAQGLTAVATDDPEMAGIALRADDADRVLARFGVMDGTSAQGLAALADGQIDIALSLRAVPAPDLRARVIALDALVPVVAPDNALPAIGLRDLAAVLTGEIDSWADLGGPDLPVRLHMRAGDAAVRALIADRLLADAPFPAPPGARAHPSDTALAAAVAADPLGLGVTLQSAAHPARVLPLQGPCGVVRSATPLAVKAGDYPLTVPLMLYTRAERLPLQARRFLAFATGTPAQALVAAAGFVDQTVTAQPLAAQGDRLAGAIAAEAADLDELRRLVAIMQGTQRLSYTFRFDAGVTALSPQSLANVERLAEALEAGRYAGRELVFAGFTDGEGRRDINKRLSVQRAEAARRAVLAAAPLFDPEVTTLRTEGFGPAMPLDCDDTHAGRQVNRRVEVWLR